MDVYDWGKAWNGKIRDDRWKRERTYLPFCFDTWVSYLRCEDKKGLRTVKILRTLGDKFSYISRGLGISLRMLVVATFQAVAEPKRYLGVYPFIRLS